MGTVSRSSWGAGSAPGTSARGSMRLAGGAWGWQCFPWGEPWASRREGLVLAGRLSGWSHGALQASGQVSGSPGQIRRQVRLQVMRSCVLASSSRAFGPGRGPSGPPCAPSARGEPDGAARAQRSLTPRGRRVAGDQGQDGRRRFRALDRGVARLGARLHRSSMLRLRPFGLDGVATRQAGSKGRRSGPYRFRVAAHHPHTGAGKLLQRLPGSVPAAGPPVPPEHMIAMGHWGVSLKTALLSDQGLARQGVLLHADRRQLLGPGVGRCEAMRVWRRGLSEDVAAQKLARPPSKRAAAAEVATKYLREEALHRWAREQKEPRPGSGADDAHALERGYETSNRSSLSRAACRPRPALPADGGSGCDSGASVGKRASGAFQCAIVYPRRSTEEGTSHKASKAGSR